MVHNEVPSSMRSEKSFVITVALVVVGCTGLHRLYVGKYFTAVLFLTVMMLSTMETPYTGYLMWTMTLFWFRDVANIVRGVFSDAEGKFVILRFF